MTLTTAYRTWLRPLIISLLLVLVIWMAQQQAEGSQPNQTPAAPASTQINETGLVISWSADQPEWESTAFGMRPVIDQFSHIKTPGAPQLPVHTVTFAIPANASYQVSVDHDPGQTLSSEHTIALAPKPQGILTNQAGDWIGGDFVEALSPMAGFDQPVVSVEEIGVMGGIRIGRATFSPLVIQDGPDAGFAYVPNARVEINFSNSPTDITKHSRQKATFIQTALDQIVVNGQHAIPGRSSSRSNQSAPTVADMVIQIDGEGMVEINQSQLQSFGISLSQLNPTQLRLTHLGQPVPILWNGDADSTFEAGESFTFYAPEFHSRWSDSTPFLLSNSASTPSPKMASRSGAPGSAANDGQLIKRVIVEDNLLYSAECGCGRLPEGWDGDRWVWAELRRPGAPTFTSEINLQNIEGSQPAFLTSHLIGFTEQASAPDEELSEDHVVAVRLNGTLLGMLRWNGKTADQTKLAIPAGVLQATNTVEIELMDEGSSIDGVWLDALEFEYAASYPNFDSQEILLGESSAQDYELASTAALSVFDVTDPYSPTVLTNIEQTPSSTVWSDSGRTNRRYAVQETSALLTAQSINPINGLRAHGEGATYLVIAPAEFASSPELGQLIDHRGDVGWQTHLETAEEIYNAFGDGDPKPEAIRDYLEWAYHNWDTRPEMVLLVGDGSTDPKQHKGGSATYIPPYLAEVDPWIGETAADNLMVAVDGVDHVPDMALGRLPVNSTEELAGVVNKILRYEQVKTAGTWNQNMLIVADNNDEAGDFVAASTSLATAYLGEPWNVISQFFGVESTNVPDVQNKIFEQWQRGAGMIMYNGHSSRHQWAAERLFHIDDVAELQNNSRLPLLIQMTCFTGSFQSSRFNTLDEQLVRQADGGAIAAWGATGLGVATGHSELADGAFNVLYGQENPTLGLAVMAGKAQLATNEPANLDLLNTFNLLGDPATVIKLDITGDNIFLPTITR